MSTRFGPGSCLFVLIGIVSLLSLLVYLGLPHHPKTAAELCGHYVLDCELEHEEVTLRPDGTFAQTVTIQATWDVASADGKWTYNTRDGYVTFEDAFMNVLKRPHELNPDYAYPRPGLTLMPAEYWFGRLILGDWLGSWPYWEKVK